MFERIGRDPDPDGCVRRIVAAVFLVAVVGCSGVMAAAEWLVWVLLRVCWELLRWLVSLWLGVSLPPLELLQPPEITVVAVEIDAPVVYDDRWEQPLPDRPLPSLQVVVEPPPVPAVGPESVLLVEDVLVEEIVHSGLLLKLIGTTGESQGGVVQNLWSDDEQGLGSIDAALSEASVIGMIGVGGGTVSGIGMGGGGTGEGFGAIGGLQGGLGMALSGVVERSARVLRLAEPDWPADGAGRCAVEVEVDKRGTGTVDGWEDCDPAVRDAVGKAVRRSAFQPAVRGGEPTAEVISVTFRRPDPGAAELQ